MAVVTDIAVKVEEVDTDINIRQSDVAVDVEEVETIKYARISDISVMVEYVQVTGYCGIDDIGLVVYREFARGLHCYLSRADEPGLDITGELTFGCWVWFNKNSRGVDVGIMGKWFHDFDQRAYVIHKKSNNEIEFAISKDGVNNLNTVTDAGINFTSGNWYYIVGRYTPSKELALFVNGSWYKNQTDIFSSIFDSTEPFEIGRYDRSNYFDGYICQVFVSASFIDDADIEAMYAHTKALFGHPPEYETVVASFGGVNVRMTNAALDIEYLPAPFDMMTNAAVMIEYLAPTYIRETNAALMIEYAPPTYIRITNAAVEAEYSDTITNLRLTNGAVEIEYKDIVDNIRTTNAAVMIEYSPNTTYIRQTNAAVMIEYEAT